MLVEIVCIIVSKFLVIILYPHRFVINVGFQHSPLNLNDLFSALLVELAVEITVDGLAIKSVHPQSNDQDCNHLETHS